MPDYKNIPFNELKSLDEIWNKTRRPVESSITQDLLKKDSAQTKYSNREIENDVGDNWKQKLKKRGGCKGVVINIGTLSLKEQKDKLSNSDSISRLTHVNIRMLAIRETSNDKSLFDKYLTTLEGDPIIRYRTEVGEYVDQGEHMQLNELIENVLTNYKSMSFYVKKYKELEEEMQIKRFIHQYVTTLRWINSIKCKDDYERINLADNLLSIYYLTFDDAVDEVKVAITTNTMKTENTEPYKLHNKLSYYVNTKYRHLNLSLKQQEKLNVTLVHNFDWLGSCLRNCKLFPDESKFNKWCGYHTKSDGTSYRGRELVEMHNVAFTHYQVLVDDIFGDSHTTNGEKLLLLKQVLNDTDKNILLKSFKSLSGYIRFNPSIHSNYYSVMLKYERKHNRILTDEELGLLKFHSVVGHLGVDLFQKWSSIWQLNMLNDIAKTNKSLGDILHDRLVKPTKSQGIDWSWYDNILHQLVYREYPKDERWASFAFTDRLLGQVSFRGVDRNSLLGMIDDFKVNDKAIRTLEHFLPKKFKVNGKVSPSRYRGGNMYYSTRKYNTTLGDKAVPEKLNEGVDSDTTLGIIFNKSSVVNKPISKLTKTAEWKNTFHDKMSNEDWIKSITKDNSIESNRIYSLRKEQLHLLIGKLHNV